jgi:hypothetical protein
VVTSFGLVVVSTWIAYEQWIAPVMLSRLPLSGVKTINKNRDKLLPAAILIRPLPRRSRTGSFSDLSDSFTVSDGASTHVIARTAQTVLGSQPLPRIWSGVQSLFPLHDGDVQSQARDLENAVPAHPTTNNNNERPQAPNRLRIKTGVVSAVHSATKMFWRGTARNVPRMSQMPAKIPNRNSPTSGTPVAPSQLDFPSQPQHVLKYAQGDVCDLEYSPEGLVLAVTR